MCIIGDAMSSKCQIVGDGCELKLFCEGFPTSIHGGRACSALLGLPTYS